MRKPVMAKIGRRKGRRSKGYFYRKGRGWGTSINQRFIPLTHPDGSFIRERNTEDAVLREAFERWKLARAEAARQAEAQSDTPSVTITEVCNFYLRYAQTEGAASTYQTRADALFDFCYALPARFRRVMEADKAPTAALRKEMEAARCKHPPFGKLSWNELLPLHLAQWTQAHPGWKGSKKTLLQAVKRALNYAVEMRLIPLNPIKGYKIPRNKPRVTYITPEQEAAMLAEANPALRMAIRVCIRTGARYFSEFARITAKHVKDDGERMEWVLESIRKVFSMFSRFSCGGSVMEHGMGHRREFAEHHVEVADSDHRSTRFRASFVVLAVATTATVPRVRSFHDPAFFQGGEPARALGTLLDLDVPLGTICFQPSLQGMVVILVVAEDDAQPREVLRRDLAQQSRCGNAIVQRSGSDQHGHQQPQRIDQQMPLAALDFLAPVVTAFLAAHLGGLHRLAVDAHRTGRRLAAFLDTDLAPQHIDELGPSAVVAPLGEILVHGALGKQVVGEHVPLATAAVQVENRVDDLPHIHGPRPTSVLGFRNQRFENRPLCIGQVGRIRLPYQRFHVQPPWFG